MPKRWTLTTPTRPSTTAPFPACSTPWIHTPTSTDPKAYAQMREDQHGRYYGVGMTIQPQLVEGAMKIFVLLPF